MPEVSVGRMPFNEAIDYFQKKLLIPSRQWTDMVGPIHAKGFTVAGATSLSLLQDLYSTVQDSILDGTTLTEFRKRFDDIVSRHGWSYKGKRGWRTRVIFQVNKRSAYMAGRWEQIWRLKDIRPFLQYLTVGDERVRQSHRPWHGIILPVDHPFWRTHYPPNDWLCRCNARSRSKDDIEEEGLKVSNMAEPTPTSYADPDTGEVVKKYKGVGIGWDYNVGQAWLAPEAIFGQQLMEIPADLRKEALKWMDTDVYDRPFKRLVNKVGTQVAKGQRPAAGHAQTAGYLASEVIEFLQSKGKGPASTVIVAKDSDIAHWLRDTKAARNQMVPISVASSLPGIVRTPDAVLYEKANGRLLFVRRLSDGRYAKFVVAIGLKGKIQHNKSRFNETLNLVKTAGIVAAYNLLQKEYELIFGEIVREAR
ncbi:phage head morphogenesis protein [Bowmanella dokdonensis]|uniref:Minor capsid protein n=1 Tax=Bowmanella dokdonensis TaxID=751969 RepID=A0A939IQM4_9ALTE|nr:phage minor head protein [Bowmanella dokdonensis]MBN7824732.1 minor capsid protein [Bowmanella dokdonensis]